MYLQDNLMLILSEEPEEEEVGISQVSLVVEEVTDEKDIYLEAGEEVDLDMDKVGVEEAALVDVEVVLKALEEEIITIVQTIIEERFTTMKLIYRILRVTLHLKQYQLLFKLMNGTISVLNKRQSKGGSIIIMMVISQ